MKKGNNKRLETTRQKNLYRAERRKKRRQKLVRVARRIAASLILQNNVLRRRLADALVKLKQQEASNDTDATQRGE